MGQKKKLLMCDPPNGWMYGFPKPVHEEYFILKEDFDIKAWLVSEGYPEQLTTTGWFYCRFFEKEIDDEG